MSLELKINYTRYPLLRAIVMVSNRKTVCESRQHFTEHTHLTHMHWFDLRYHKKKEPHQSNITPHTHIINIYKYIYSEQTLEMRNRNKLKNEVKKKITFSYPVRGVQ